MYPGREANLEDLNVPHLPNGPRGGRSPTRGGGGDEDSVSRMPKTQEEVIWSRAQTQLTSNIIKSTLHDIKASLFDMRKNKKVVAQGMAFLDRNQQRDRDQ